nr:PREDICTED: uncharacterized protein LOC109434872 isoform X3 [Rhinolophus sinicus]
MWAQGAAPSPPSWHLLCSGPVSTSLLSRDSSCVTRCDFTSYIASQGDTPGSPLPEARIQGNGGNRGSGRTELQLCCEPRAGFRPPGSFHPGPAVDHQPKAPSSGNPNVLLCKAASVSGVLMLEEVIHTCGTSALTSFIRSFAHSAVSSVTKPRLTSLISSLDLAGGDGAQLGEGRAAPRQVRGKWGLAEGGILESPWGGKTGEGGWL